MLEIIKLNAALRPESGKGPSHRLRLAGQIPAIAYGRDTKATPVAVAPKALLQVLSSDHGQNSVVELDIQGGEKMTVMVRDYSYHPITRELEHADFMRVKLDEPVNVEIPFRCVGKSKGIILGGVLQQVFRRLPVSCLPERIPASIEIDITELDMGESLKASQIKMPEGVKLRIPDEQTVVVVSAPEKAGEDEAKAQAAGAATAATAGAAAAPAAGAKAAAGAKPAAAAPAKADKKK